MAAIDVSRIQPVGEFGSKAWCEACAAYGVRLLKEAGLPAGLQWGFSEDYTNPPARLLTAGRRRAAYWFMVANGKITGGDGISPKCRAPEGRRRGWRAAQHRGEPPDALSGVRGPPCD